MKHLLFSTALSALLVLTAACGSSTDHPADTSDARTSSTTAPVRTSMATTAQPDRSAPTTQEVEFRSHHFRLSDDLQLPAGPGPHPAIIMVHGDGDVDRYDSGKYRPIMNEFLEAGFVVLSWDKPGTGRSTGEFEDGAWIITDRAEILVDSIGFLTSRPEIDANRIGVWGISQAGFVIPKAMTMTDDISFMIIISGPVTDGIDQSAYVIEQKMICEGEDPEDAEVASRSYAGASKARTYDDYRVNQENLIEYPSALMFSSNSTTSEGSWTAWDPNVDAFFDPAGIIDSSPIPILAVFGTLDKQVDPVQGAERYQAAFARTGAAQSQVLVFESADHNIVVSDIGCLRERASRPVAAWLDYAPGCLDALGEWLATLADDEA